MAGFNLFVGGDYYWKDDVSLYTRGKEYLYDDMNLYHSGQTPPASSVNLYTSGDNVQYKSMPLHSITGLEFNYTLDDSSYLKLYTKGAENVIEDKEDPKLNLFLKAPEPPAEISDNRLNLFMSAPSGEQMYFSMMLSVWHQSYTEIFSMEGTPTLYVSGNVAISPVSGSMPLYLENYVPTTPASGSLNLFVADDNTIRWDSDYPGLNIAPDDDIYATVPATDAIRGVQLICYGNCTIGTCQDVSVETHDTVWFEPLCVDGGIFRASDVYTNPDVNAFGSDVPYSGHFYGIRKIDGLWPLQKYYISVIGQAGSSTKIPAPKELTSWEYTIDGSDIAYSGLKLVGDSFYQTDTRNAGDEYGSSLSLKGDLLAVGSPHIDIEHEHQVLDDDPATYTLQDAGTVFLYRRGPEPNFDQIAENKAPWEFEAQLSLPSGIMRDRYRDTPDIQEDGISIVLRNWTLGQEGRNFGSNVHTYAISNEDPWITSSERELVAVSAPNAKWFRTFPDLAIQPNEILFFVFTDEFLPSFTVNIQGSLIELTYRDIVKTVRSKNLLYTYYSLPTISLSIKIIVFHPIDFDLQSSPDFPEPQPTFITKRPITRHRNEAYNSQEFLDIDDEILEQIKEAFNELYPYDTSKQHNNIPAILGVYVDNSRSLGSSAIEPALGRFKEYFQEYAFNSGVVDVFGNPSSGAVLSTTSLDENWILQTNTLIDFALDSGRLINEDFLKLLTDPATFGVFNENLPEFNIPPSSGGCVYLFEKESGSWNLIQEIFSPTNDNTIPADLFGKSVKVSEDGSILAIGSPYINQAVTIYERDPFEQNRMYSNIEDWVDYHLEQDQFNEYYAQLKFNIDFLKASGNFEDGDSGVYRTVFLDMSHQEKYDYRNDVDYWVDALGEDIIQEYKQNFTYSYTDIDYKGTYLSVVNEFAPTSRMGYSVAVEDSGNAVAFGCPTDSLDEFDDTNTYYNPDNSGQILWPSYVNTGAVRVLDAVKYFRHDKVVEYSKFGNRDRTVYEEDHPETFQHFGDVFSEINKTFTRTSFDEYDIPDDAGIVMIICPEVDFSNIEVMNRLKRWLDLGDRNLVLVGNDGNFEQNGRYNVCNPILNTVLSKLNSSMRLVNAPNTQNAILGNNNACPSRPNVLSSFVPENSIETYIDAGVNIYGNGVADIRMYAPDIDEQYICNDYYKQNNDHCSPPLTNYGDLRASWKDSSGVRNWPAVFSEKYDNNRQPPVPLMVAGYYKPSITVDIPAIPPTSGLFQYYEYIQTDVAPDYSKNLSSNEIQFAWTEDLQLYNGLNTNIATNNNVNRFFNPPYKMLLDPVLQCKASNGVDTVLGEELVSDLCHLAATEAIPYRNGNAAFLIGTLFTESLEVLYSGLGDKNINFYFNMVAKDRFGSSYIAQLNGWSGRSDFTDANSDSILELIFRNTGNTVSTNVNLQQLISGHPNGTRYDVCWIANPVNIPTESEVDTLKKWLNQNNKKVIVTYDNEIAAKSAEVLLELLGVSMKPLYLTNKARFADNYTDVSYDTRNFYFGRHKSENHFFPKINPLNIRARYGFVSERDSITELTMNSLNERFIPIDLQQGLSIANLGHGIADDKFHDVGFYYMKSGTARVSFPVQSNTGYRLFFNTARYSSYEKEPLNIYITNCNDLPSFTSPFVPPDQDIYNLNSDDTISSVFNGPVGVIRRIGGGQKTLLDQTVIDIQTLAGVNEISVYISADKSRLDSYDNTPSTVALVGISGGLVDIVEAPVMSRIPKYEWRRTSEGSEAYTTTLDFPEPFPIQSDSSRYCPGNLDFFSLDDCSNIFTNSLIEDGPVVVAQELYYSNITNQGINPSRITVISDASIIEGPCIFVSGEVVEENANFIRSLYPDTEFPENQNSKLFRSTEMTKIVSPERSSPARLFAGVGNSGLIERFLPDNSSVVDSGSLMSIFKETVDYSQVQRPELLQEDTQTVFNAFKDSQTYYGSNSKFSYSIDGTLYKDVDARGGKPLVIDTYGGDFIDSDVFASGYPGDLFGFSIDYHRGKLVVGSPFAAYQGEEPINWDSVIAETEQYETPFGTLVSRNGGAGSVYIYEKTGEGITLSGDNRLWEFKKKLRPSSIGVGQDLDDTVESTLTEYLGENSYSLDDLLRYSTFTDQFGYHVKIYSDIIAVGAPGHDYSINADLANSILASGAYEFKSFNFEFDAKPRTLIDLGDPDVREAIGLISGVMNNGAVYTFENRITNTRTKEQSWVMVEKLIPDGYNARLQQSYDEVAQVIASGTENEHFGENIALYRPKRTDADYTIAVGTPHHKFAPSGNHITGDLENAGAAFLFDAMLRERPPYLADSGCYINAEVFGIPTRKVSLNIDNSELNSMHYSNGVVYSNTEGEIFIEASGQDANLQGFSIHRPYIRAVYGRVYDDPDAIDNSSNMRLYMEAVSGVSTINMPIYCSVGNNAYVYNNVNLYIDAYGQSGDNELFLYAHNVSGVSAADDIWFHTIATDTITENISFYLRGY
jgi:hypothetical protein